MSALPVLVASELDRQTVLKMYERLDALIEYRDLEDTSCLTYMDGLEEMRIELVHLLEGHDV